MKSASEMARNAKKATGLDTRCLACQAEYRKQLYQRRKERHAEYHKAYRLANGDRVRALERASRERNPERRREVTAKSRERNREKRAEYNREWSRLNREKAVAKTRRWQMRHPEKVCEAVKRRAHLKRGATVIDFTLEQLAQRLSMFAGCWMCSGEWDTVDHVKPLSKGGAHMLANLRPACRSCNCRKNNTWPYPTAT